MKDTLDKIREWLEIGHSVALASVINTWGSSPRPIGAVMAVSEKGQIAGSVSGGCVEAAVIQEALDVIEYNTPSRIHFGVTDVDAWEVGLACGGEIEIFIRPFTEVNLKEWSEVLNLKTPFHSVMLIKSEDHLIGQEIFKFTSASDPDIFPNLKYRFGGILPASGHEIFFSENSDSTGSPRHEYDEVFVTVHNPPRELILVGGVHIAIPLVGIAQIMGFNITVIDPRGFFSTEERFPDVNLLAEWPSTAFDKLKLTSSSAVVMLTHDPKIDDPAIITALASPAFYVGALGSNKTHQKRLERLLKEGVSEARLKQIHAPVGLDLGGRLPEEIAISVMAQIVSEWNK